ncbi:hypothetical protein MRX96_006113 [Rhipicephalus microplus]
MVKVSPCYYSSDHADVERKIQKACLLNCKLLKCLQHVAILNAEGTRPGSQRGEPTASPHGRNHRDVATWTSQDGGDPPVSYVSSRPWRRQERARVGVAPAHLYRPFQGRTVEDADRRANGACLPVPAGTRFCECGAVVIHNSHELGKLHRHRTQATQPSSRESSQERSGAAVRAMLARAAQEADFAQWLLRVASGHASSESPPAPLSITATVERGAAGPGETLQLNSFLRPSSYKPDYMERVTTSRRSVVVWGCITSQGLRPLFRIQGNFMADKCCDLLENVALPHVTSDIFHDDFIFQQDKSPIHTSKKARKLLENKGVTVLEWPPRSPHINIIEYVWGIIKAALARHGIHGASAKTPWKAVQDEWKRLRMDKTLADELYESLPQRMRDVLNGNGDFTRY